MSRGKVACGFAGCGHTCTGGYCASHRKQLRRAGNDVTKLRPLRGAHGRVGNVRVSTRTRPETAERLREIGRRFGADPDAALYLGAQVVLERHAEGDYTKPSRTKGPEGGHAK